MMPSPELMSLERTLRNSPIPPLRRLEIEEHDETIVLSGTVSSFYLKQLAQEAILPHLGRRKLSNQVQVVNN